MSEHEMLDALVWSYRAGLVSEEEYAQQALRVMLKGE